MERMHRLISIAAATGLLWPVYSAHAALINLDLSTWVVEQYELNVQADASWTVSGAENEIAFQSVNADASIFHGGFESVGTRIEGTFEVATANDDDLIGFVFGYQNRGQYYLFDWKQADQGAAGLGFAERGMTVKVVDTGGVDPTGRDCKLNCVTAHRPLPLMIKEMGNERNRNTRRYCIPGPQDR